MKPQRALLAFAVTAALLAGCQRSQDSDTARPADSAQAGGDKAAQADAFIARVNEELRADYPEATAAQWLSQTYIGDDSAIVNAKASERALAKLSRFVEESRQFQGVDNLKPETARALQLLKLATVMPAPKDPKKLSALTGIATKLDQMYGAGKYCKDEGGKENCRQLGQLEDVLANKDSTYEQQLDAWTGWHSIAVPMRKDYQQFVELSNEGTRDLGYADTGALWRSGYDMPADAFKAETDRLWGQVKPLYEQLQCYVRGRLVEKYGDKGQMNGMIPAHLTGNMWAQQWGNIWDIVAPYKDEVALSVTPELRKQRDAGYNKLLGALDHAATADDQVEIERQADLASARAMAERAQDFYVSLGMPKLPDSFWTKAQFIKPRDRDVVCHASAWDMNYAGDVRIKMCIKPTDDEFNTIYHELGHVYYYLAYNKLPPIFQSGAHDGFHEAIGDTIVLSMTPKYLASIGMLAEPKQSQEALINAQMRMALDKVAFLPFGLLIDRWRWGVFDGSIKPENYNAAWWQLHADYQGVAPPSPRGEEFFDPGAKYHVPGNTPYTRYFLAHILQFQFYEALCDAAGHTGPLHECSYYGNRQAGQKYWAMLQKGQSQPWQQTLKQLTGGEKMDAGPVLEYFAPLKAWLEQRNQGQQCGWGGLKQ